jgi:O-methyltransferase
MILKLLKKNIKKYLDVFNYSVTRTDKLDPVMDNDEIFCRIYNEVKPFTMTSKERMFSLYKSVEYVIQNNIPGDFVECGVWKGGSAMLIAVFLLELKVKDRKIYLYDTFEGMSEPTNDDHKMENSEFLAIDKWNKQKTDDADVNEWCYAGLDEVRSNMMKTGYTADKIIFVKGKVEETIPTQAPSAIAILRLDTDWYESTRHELLHLYPLLSNKGVLIIDDYGHWAGAKKAVDEYFKKGEILLNRVDITGRVAIKFQ